MKAFFKEFKEFAVKGNMMDMAIGIIIGASFNKVIDVLVKKVFMPPLSLMTDGIKFQDKKIILRNAVLDETEKVTTAEVAIEYGALFEALLDFMIIGITVFVVVKAMNRLKNKSQDPKDKTVKTPKDIQLLTDLNELMAEQNKILKSKVKD
ncbi:large conductance mechanosensitive channel [Lacinutrix venerupis]|uniref:Large-conductance mechanosensitive channel n=1 Tax=Lacinutrix venerupis TaxID=1486034 RepID=A0AAC9LNA8_9FLAO|nr:large conductance mechanosensitive channel protein MscL [Lacinutrix venerupis]APY00522.1 mechanosensitive ion channel protein MscL [Lacinutrix venerupis]RLJ68646.1 large conductance mechanosensitive channel [Lacinutrix venerupis]